MTGAQSYFLCIHKSKRGGKEVGRPFLSQSHSFGGSESWNGEERERTCKKTRSGRDKRQQNIICCYCKSFAWPTTE